MDTLNPDYVPPLIAIPVVIVLLVLWVLLELRARKKRRHQEKLAAFAKAVDYCAADAEITMRMLNAQPKYERRITK